MPRGKGNITYHEFRFYVHEITKDLKCIHSKQFGGEDRYREKITPALSFKAYWDVETPDDNYEKIELEKSQLTVIVTATHNTRREKTSEQQIFDYAKEIATRKMTVLLANIAKMRTGATNIFFKEDTHYEEYSAGQRE